MITVKSALTVGYERLKNQELPHLEAEILLAHTLQVERIYLIMYPQNTLSAQQYAVFQDYLQQRAAGLPIAYIVGHKEFWSLDLLINRLCLIPRPDTELLVSLVLEKFPTADERQVADLGTGCGAIALAIAHEKPTWRIVATEKNALALGMAKENQQRLKLANIQWLLGHWCNPLKHNFYDMIVANPPYIDAQDPHLTQGDVRFEPRAALISDNNGLADIEEIIRTAPSYLKPRGWLLLEHGYQQAKNIQCLYKKYGFQAITTEKDYANHDRVTMGLYR